MIIEEGRRRVFMYIGAPIHLGDAANKHIEGEVQEIVEQSVITTQDACNALEVLKQLDGVRTSASARAKALSGPSNPAIKAHKNIKSGIYKAIISSPDISSPGLFSQEEIMEQMARLGFDRSDIGFNQEDGSISVKTVEEHFNEDFKFHDYKSNTSIDTVVELRNDIPVSNCATFNPPSQSVTFNQMVAQWAENANVLRREPSKELLAARKTVIEHSFGLLRNQIENLSSASGAQIISTLKDKVSLYPGFVANKYFQDSVSDNSRRKRIVYELVREDRVLLACCSTAYFFDGIIAGAKVENEDYDKFVENILACEKKVIDAMYEDEGSNLFVTDAILREDGSWDEQLEWEDNASWNNFWKTEFDIARMTEQYVHFFEYRI